jgi:hypothetical protein
MKQFRLAVLVLVVATFSSNVTFAAMRPDGDETESKFSNARVIEVTDSHISVIANTGVEHVVAVDGNHTAVLVNGNRVSIKNLREGDLVTIELDVKNPVMFAREIQLTQHASEVAVNDD